MVCSHNTAELCVWGGRERGGGKKMEEQGSRTEHRRIELGGRELQDGDGSEEQGDSMEQRRIERCI